MSKGADPPVAVVTDSTADIPAEVAARLGITVVPLVVNFGSEGFRDGIDLTPDQFWAKLKSAPALPTTSQPTVAAFQAAYAPLIEAGRSVVSIHIAGKLSGTVRSAELAAQEFPPGAITVIDSNTVAMALGWLAIAAAEQAAAGAPIEAVAEHVRALLPRCGILVALDTLENLRRGGRIGRAGAFIGTLLNIKPILQVREGEVHPLERVRTRGKALQRIAELAREQAPFERLAVAHGHDAEACQQLAALVRDLAPTAPGSYLQTELGPVLGTHTGPGVFGVCFIRAR